MWPQLYLLDPPEIAIQTRCDYAIFEATTRNPRPYYRASACNACRARYCRSNSISPSVHPVPVLCRNDCTNCRIFDGLVGASYRSLSPTAAVTKFKGNTSTGALNIRRVGIFFVIIALYQDNGIRDRPNSYYGTLIRSHR